MTGAFQDTRHEPDLDDVLWHVTELFHKKTARMQRQLDDNEDRQKKSQDEQDGSEVRSVELERLIALGLDLIERREAFEHMRDSAAECYETATGSAWRPRAGSLVNHKRLTAAMIDSRDFIAARRRADTECCCPKAQDRLLRRHRLHRSQAHLAVLDQVLAKHPTWFSSMAARPKAPTRAACWADKRGVTQIAFKPDWIRDGKAAPFKRNDRLLDIVPMGVIVFPGSGITGNLADKAKKLGIPVLDHRGGA